MRFNKPIRDSGRTIVEILFFALNCVIGGVVASLAGKKFGVPGYLFGFIGGWLLMPIAVFVFFQGALPLLFSWGALRQFPVRWRINYLLLGLGFAGLGITRLIAELFFGGEQSFYKTAYGWHIVVALGLAFIFALIVLLPINVALDRRDPSLIASQPQVPRWIMYPLLIIAGTMAAIIIFGLLAYFLLRIFSTPAAD